MKYQEQPNCNRCATKMCKGMNRPQDKCLRWTNPDGKFMLAELVLAHATSLNEALTDLPFDCNLNFYLR